jgi:hypothetical protein
MDTDYPSKDGNGLAALARYAPGRIVWNYAESPPRRRLSNRHKSALIAP